MIKQIGNFKLDLFNKTDYINETDKINIKLNCTVKTDKNNIKRKGSYYPIIEIEDIGLYEIKQYLNMSGTTPNHINDANGRIIEFKTKKEALKFMAHWIKDNQENFKNLRYYYPIKRSMYLFIAEDRIKGMHEDLEVVKKWCSEYETKYKINCFIALEVKR